MKPALLLCIVTIMVSILMAACTNENRELTLNFSTEEPAPSLAMTIKSRFAEENISIAARIAADPAEIFESIQSGNVDLGVVEEPDQPIPGVVTIAPLYPSVLHVLYNSATEPKDFVELIRHSNIYAGPVGGASHRLLSQLAQDFDVSDDDFQLLDNPWTQVPDVYFVFGGLLSDDSVRQLDGYKLFSFARQDDAPGASVADAIVFRHHHLKPFLLPRSTYYTISNEPVMTLSIRTVMIAREDFPTDLAFAIASHLFDNAQEFSLDYPLVMQELNVGVNAVDLMFPLHEGSRRYLNRDKPGIVERYVDVFALLLTVVLAVASGIFALYRHQRRIKKDRVDDFYSKLLVVRHDAAKATERKDLKLLRERSIAVQEEVLHLLIDERIAADAALVAFLSLSNQVINELNYRLDFNL